ncbi:MAG: hypothetical protein JXR19_06940 [Bacteroidia bacterium]
MEDILIAIITSTLFVLVMIIAAAWLVISAVRKKNSAELQLKEEQVQRQKEINLTTLSTQEHERKRIGMDLHDDLGPSFSVIKMNLGQAKQKLKKGDTQESISAILDQASDNLEEAVGRFSDLSKMLYPVVLKKKGLKIALEDLLNKSNGFGIEITSVIEDFEANTELEALSIYRIAQEALNNGLKHSNAKHISVQWLDRSHHHIFKYEDDGQGFDLDHSKLGIGMQSIHSRAHAIDASLDIKTSVGNGVQIDIRL